MKVVVFGATGTIGRPLVDALAQEHDVTAVSRREHLVGDGVTWAVADAKAAETTAQAAERAGMRQLVYLGGLGDDSPDLSAHLRSRHETGRRLASTSVPVTTMRAAIVIGRDSAAFE